MSTALLAILGGFTLLTWSAERFVQGAAVTARQLGMPPLLIGILIVGFGTSAPEMVVSAMAALDGNPGLALGNALGSNIINIGLIVGITALVAPLSVNSRIVRNELPLLLAIGAVVGVFFLDNALTRPEALLLLAAFFFLIGWSTYTSLKGRGDPLERETEQELTGASMTTGRAVFWLVAGLLVLIVSSRILVWGAVAIARTLGVSELIIGLTVVAMGTSLPELATSITATRKSEHDIALGNIVGSNMFNLLAVVGIAGALAPMSSLAQEILSRDWNMMMLLTLILTAMAWRFRGTGRITRPKGALLLLIFIGYNTYLIVSIVP